MARPRRLDPEDMRKQIVTTARHILRDEGRPALTARALAQALSMPASAIYRIFPTMGDVIMAVNEATFVELDRLFEAAPADWSSGERLMDVAGGYMRFMRDNPSLWHALFASEGRRGDYPPWYLQAIHRLMQRLTSLLAEACPSLSATEAQEAAGQLYVMAHGALSLELDGRLSLITTLNAQDLALKAIRNLLVELRHVPLRQR